VGKSEFNSIGLILSSCQREEIVSGKKSTVERVVMARIVLVLDSYLVERNRRVGAI
jgi:hypothetical protein